MAEKCPLCAVGNLRSKKVREELFGVPLGVFDAEVCEKCHEVYFTADSVDKIESRAKELGLWGLASKVKVARSGNSLVIRIPAPLARYLKLRNGQDVLLTPEQKHKLVLELA
jgi:ribosomal protein L40E